MKQHTITLNESGTAKLICYLQDNPAPAMVVCPGGGYFMLTYNEGEPIAVRMFSEGFHAFVLEYPVGLGAIWPNATAAAVKAIALIRKNATEWKVRADTIGIMGFSAGGHVAATAGTYWNDPEVCAAAGISEQDGRPDAIGLIYPVIGATMPCIENQKLITKLIRCDQAVTAETPPAFIATTYGDTLVSCDQSLNMASALSKQDVPFELHCFQPGNHGSLNGGGMPGDASSRRLSMDCWFPLYKEWLLDLFGPCNQMAPPADDPGDAPQPFTMVRNHADYYPVSFGLSDDGPQITNNTKLSRLLSDPAAAEILMRKMPELKNISLQDDWTDIPLNALLLAIGQGCSPFAAPYDGGILDELKQIHL